ncbi:hypothetical protein O6H91_22G054500 [Diphasiastrum complanatum]|nr:hypothetical protein O6H91_22G054500 [Diphasiastrum complanatum]
MGSDSSSTSSMESRIDPPSGFETELLKVRGAQLYLIDEEESVLMQAGDFSLILVKQGHSPLAAVAALVGDVEWPVGKDSPVLKIANRCYTFALPGLNYGLVLSETTPLETSQYLESLMMQYSTFEARPEVSAEIIAGIGDIDFPSATEQIHAADYWTAVADNVESTSIMVARQIRSNASITASCANKSGERACSNLKKTVKSKIARPVSPEVVEISPRMRERMQQARRMSAVAKLFTRALQKGAILASGHVANYNTLVGTFNSSSSKKTFPSAEMRDVALANVDVCTKVVEAVETAGRSLFETTSSIESDLIGYKQEEQEREIAKDNFVPVENITNHAWTLNKIGLRMLLRATAASTFLNFAHRISSASISNASQNTSPLTETSVISQQPSVACRMSFSPATPQPGETNVAAAPAAHRITPPLQISQFFPGSPAAIRSPAPFDPSPTNYPSFLSTPTPHFSDSPFQQYIPSTGDQQSSQIPSYFAYSLEPSIKDR